MTTELTLFEQPQLAPSYLQNSAVAKALAEQMEGGLAGRQINRLSLRNSKFRFVKQGVEIGVSTNPTLDVVIVAANPSVGRLWWEKGFENDQAGQRPDCYSRDGKAPEADAAKPQSSLCATCPQNAAGSAKNGKGKACSYKKRVIIVAPGALAGDAYALDVGSMSMFGDDQPAQRKFSLKGYIEALKANGLIVPAVVTRLAFDDNESVPKLDFTPVRVLTEAEFRVVEQRITDPAIIEMLDDIDRKSEEGKPIGAPAQIAAPTPVQQVQQPAAQPAPVAQPAPAPAPAAAPAAPKPRGRPRQAEAAPAAAPAPQAAPAATMPAGFGAAPASSAPPGFGAPAPQPAQQAATAAAAPAGFTVDLDAFDA